MFGSHQLKWLCKGFETPLFLTAILHSLYLAVYKLYMATGEWRCKWYETGQAASCKMQQAVDTNKCLLWYILTINIVTVNLAP